MHSIASVTTANEERSNRRRELIVWGVVLVLLNVPLLACRNSSALAFLPGKVAAGEWWRLFTHPFVHVSWYHFLLDGTAFLFLWQNLEGQLSKRLGTLVASAVGSLLFAAVGSHAFWSLGLCGLSGIAHGVMAQQGLDLHVHGGSRQERRLGGLLFVAVLAKSLRETFTGAALFGHWHLGSVGMPIVACHLGGVCGALFFHVIKGASVNSRS